MTEDQRDELLLKIDSKMDNMEGRMSHIEGKIDNMEEQMSYMKDRVSEIQGDVLEIKYILYEWEPVLDYAQKNTTKNTKKLSLLENKINSKKS